MAKSKKSYVIDQIEEFAKEHNVPIYKELPEGFHIDEGALTAPTGTKWIKDNGSILKKTVRRGLLLDREMIRLLESPYSIEEVYSQMTESEKEIFDLTVDYGDMEGAEKIIEDKRRELSKDVPLSEDKLTILGYYVRQRDANQYIHYAIGQEQYLTNGVVTWSDKIQERLATLIPMEEKAFDLRTMQKYLLRFEPYGKLTARLRELVQEENRKMEQRRMADQSREETMLQERSKKHVETH